MKRDPRRDRSVDARGDFLRCARRRGLSSPPAAAADAGHDCRSRRAARAWRAPANRRRRGQAVHAYRAGKRSSRARIGHAPRAQLACSMPAWHPARCWRWNRCSTGTTESRSRRPRSVSSRESGRCARRLRMTRARSRTCSRRPRGVRHGAFERPRGFTGSAGAPRGFVVRRARLAADSRDGGAPAAGRTFAAMGRRPEDSARPADRRPRG